jgi:phosphoesterase RecJ-like protein
MMTIAETAELLFRENDYLIITHGNPDGDTCGSAAGLCTALRALGKRAYICPNPTITERYVPFIARYLSDDDYSPGFIISVDIADTALFTDLSFNNTEYNLDIGREYNYNRCGYYGGT